MRSLYPIGSPCCTQLKGMDRRISYPFAREIQQTFSFLPSKIHWRSPSAQYTYSALSPAGKRDTKGRTIIFPWSSGRGGRSPVGLRATKDSRYCLLRLVAESLRTALPSSSTYLIPRHNHMTLRVRTTRRFSSEETMALTVW